MAFPPTPEEPQKTQAWVNVPTPQNNCKCCDILHCSDWYATICDTHSAGTGNTNTGWQVTQQKQNNKFILQHCHQMFGLDLKMGIRMIIDAHVSTDVCPHWQCPTAHLIYDSSIKCTVLYTLFMKDGPQQAHYFSGNLFYFQSGMADTQRTSYLVVPGLTQRHSPLNQYKDVIITFINMQRPFWCYVHSYYNSVESCCCLVIQKVLLAMMT